MGDGGAAPMQVEIGKDNARDPTGEFIVRGENFLAKIYLVKFSENLANLTATFSKI